MSGWGSSPWGSSPWGDPTGIVDQDLIDQIIYMTLENGNADADGTTLLTDMFDIPQIVAALNQRQYQFLRDTGCVYGQESLPAPAQQQRYTVSPNYIDTRRLGYLPQGGQSYALFRTDPWALDTALPTWQTSSGIPQTWQQVTLPTRSVEIAPVPSTGGTVSHLFVGLSTVLDGLGVPMTVPDEFSWAIMYGCLADLLGSDGPGLDLKRATYCESRYQQGVELCRLLIEGAMGGGQ